MDYESSVEAWLDDDPAPIPRSPDLEMGVFKGGLAWHILTQKHKAKKQQIAAGLCGTIGIVTHHSIIISLQIGSFSHICIDCIHMHNTEQRAPDICFDVPVPRSLDGRKI